MHCWVLCTPEIINYKNQRAFDHILISLFQKLVDIPEITRGYWKRISAARRKTKEQKQQKCSTPVFNIWANNNKWHFCSKWPRCKWPNLETWNQVEISHFLWWFQVLNYRVSTWNQPRIINNDIRSALKFRSFSKQISVF